MMKTHYLDDRIVVSKNGNPQYGFKIKGGKYGDLRTVANAECRKTGNRSGLDFAKTQFDYNGSYE